MVASPLVAVLRWRAHWVLRDGRSEVCLACSKAGNQRLGRRLLATACPGFAAATAALLAPLRAGAFNITLAAGLPAWVERASWLGWLPVTHGNAPAHFLIGSAALDFALPPD